MPRPRRFFTEDLFEVKSCVLCGNKLRFWQRKGVWTDYWYDQGSGSTHSYLCHKKCVKAQRLKDSRVSLNEAVDISQMLERVNLFISTYKSNEADEYLLALLPNVIKQSKNIMGELGKNIEKLERYQEEAKKNILMKKLAGINSNDGD